MRRAQKWSALAVRPRWTFATNSELLQKKTARHLTRSASSVPRYVTAEREETPHVRRVRPESPQHSQNLHDDRHLIIPGSLAQTLRAHRIANQDSIIIRKRRTYGGNDVLPTRSEGDVVMPRLQLDRDGKHTSRSRQQEDYVGKSRALSLDWEIIGDLARYMSTPWMASLDDKGISRDLARERLSKEIRAADSHFTPNAKEAAAAKRALGDIESFVATRGRNFAKLELIGSRASGLATPLSDLDLNLRIQNELGRSNEATSFLAFDALSALFRMMKYKRNNAQDPVIMTSYFAAKARVPIIVGHHVSTGLEFQIQSASSGYGSLETVKGLAAEYPTLTALFRIIKQALKMRGLAAGMQGGLTSYPLLIMIAVSLKQNAAYADPHNVGSHLLQFLEFYSKIDFYTTGITHVPSRHVATSDRADTAASAYADEPTAFSSIGLVTQDPVGAVPMLFNRGPKLALVHDGKKDFMMELHDPANPYNDLGRSAYSIKHIQATFMEFHDNLKKKMMAWDQQIRAEGQALPKPPSLLEPLIKGDYSMYNLERKRLCS